MSVVPAEALALARAAMNAADDARSVRLYDELSSRWGAEVTRAVWRQAADEYDAANAEAVDALAAAGDRDDQLDAAPVVDLEDFDAHCPKCGARLPAPGEDCIDGPGHPRYSDTPNHERCADCGADFDWDEIDYRDKPPAPPADRRDTLK